MINEGKGTEKSEEKWTNERACMRVHARAANASATDMADRCAVLMH